MSDVATTYLLGCKNVSGTEKIGSTIHHQKRFGSKIITSSEDIILSYFDYMNRKSDLDLEDSNLIILHDTRTSGDTLPNKHRKQKIHRFRRYSSDKH